MHSQFFPNLTAYRASDLCHQCYLTCFGLGLHRAMHNTHKTYAYYVGVLVATVPSYPFAIFDQFQARSLNDFCPPVSRLQPATAATGKLYGWPGSQITMTSPETNGFNGTWHTPQNAMLMSDDENPSKLGMRDS